MRILDAELGASYREVSPTPRRPMINARGRFLLDVLAQRGLDSRPPPEGQAPARPSGTRCYFII
jgi:hypothetical protein